MNEKLDVAGVFERIFAIYRDQFSLLIPAALVVFVPIAILNGLLLAGGGVLAALAVAALAAIGTYWYQGMVVEAARDIMDGRRDHTVASLLGSATPVIVPLLGAGILAGIGIGIGLLLLIVPGLFLLTIWAVIAPVIVIERAGILEAFGRSRALVRGHGWQVFGVIVVLFVLQLVLGLVVNAIFGAIDDNFAVFAVSDLIVRLLIAPLSALAAAVMYFRLKSLKGEPLPAGGAYQPTPAQAADVAQPAAPTPPAPSPRAPAAPGPREPAAPPHEPPAPPSREPAAPPHEPPAPRSQEPAAPPHEPPAPRSQEPAAPPPQEPPAPPSQGPAPEAAPGSPEAPDPRQPGGGQPTGP